MRKIPLKFRKPTKKVEQKVQGTFLDSSLVLWKLIDDEWYGKRVVQTNTLRNVWLEDVKPDEDVKNWWHGADADYGQLVSEVALMVV